MGRLKHIIHINIILGAWLVIPPFATGYSMSTVELANDVGLGALLIGCSWWLLAASTGQVGVSMLQLLGGIWVIAAPLLLHYEHTSGHPPTTWVWEFCPFWSVRRKRGCLSRE